MAQETEFRRPPSPPAWLNAAANAIFTALLKSPLHGLASGITLVIAFKGVKSGKVYSFPVGYYDYHDGQLALIPLHRWWVNLRDDVPVTVWLKGRQYRATASAALGDDQTVRDLEALIAGSGNLTRMYRIERDAAGRPDPERTRRLARTLPLVRIRLGQE